MKYNVQGTVEDLFRVRAAGSEPKGPGLDPSLRSFQATRASVLCYAGWLKGMSVCMWCPRGTEISCLWARAHVCMFVCTYVCVYVRTSVCMCARMCVCMYVRLSVCMAATARL